MLRDQRKKIVGAMGEPDKVVKIQDEVIEIPNKKEGEEEDDVLAEVCIDPGHHHEDSGFSNGEEDDEQHRLSELEDALWRRCFDKVTFSIIFIFLVQIFSMNPKALLIF